MASTDQIDILLIGPTGTGKTLLRKPSPACSMCLRDR